MVAEAPERLTVSIPEFAHMAGISRNFAYKLAQSGSIEGIPVVKLGSRLVLPRERVVEYLRGIEANVSSEG